MIEHDMPLIMDLADWIYCLDAGRVLAQGRPEQVQAHPAVIEAYLGTPTERSKMTAAVEEREVATSDEVLLDVEELDVFYDKVQVLYGVDFEVRRGERVALLGTNGAGKSTILRAASGLVPMAGGTIRWKGDDITRIPAERLVRLGLGHVPGGRGLFPGLTVEQQASFALGYTDRAYFLEKGEVRYEGPSAGLLDRPDLLRSVFLAGAAAGFGASQ